jgi:DNA-binding MarR family transcriptional regulator
MGIYAIRDRASGHLLLGASRNVHAALNRARFELGMGKHADRVLQAEFHRSGVEGLAFEVLELGEGTRGCRFRLRERTESAGADPPRTARAGAMSEEALQACVDRHLEHAALVFMLDDELGTHHGLSWADFVLLTVLDAAGGAAPATELARTLCTPASRLLLRLLPLEKTGLVERAADGDGKRRVTLRPQGRRLLHEARDTAAAACAT